MWQLLAITSAIFSAIADIFEKKALFKIEPVGFSLLLSAVTFLLALPLLYFVEFSQISKSPVFVLYLKSVLGAVAFLIKNHLN